MLFLESDCVCGIVGEVINLKAKEKKHLITVVECVFVSVKVEEILIHCLQFSDTAFLLGMPCDSIEPCAFNTRSFTFTFALVTKFLNLGCMSL